MTSIITRRAALAGAIASTAALAFPAAATFHEPAPEPRLERVEGWAGMTINARTVIVDTADCPKTQLVKYEDQGAGGWQERFFVPDADSEYAFITFDGKLKIGNLVAGCTSYRLAERRLGFEATGDRGVIQQVKVIGRVIAG